MAPEEVTTPQRDLRATLEAVVKLFDKQGLVATLATRETSPRAELVQTILAKQHLAELERKLGRLHPADIAYVLEGLPPERRRTAWAMVRAEVRGAVLLELSDAVRASLIAEMPEGELVGAVQYLGAEEIAYLLPSLQEETAWALLAALDREDRSEVQAMLAFPPGTVGALMELEVPTVREDEDLEAVLRSVRARGGLPERMDQLFVVDAEGTFKGALPLRKLLVHDPKLSVAEVMVKDTVSFNTDDPAALAVQAFERYDLITAPVLNLHRRLVGAVTVDAVMDHLNETVERERLKQVGLSEYEDLFASIWKSAKNRWGWLALNLVTAFAASRVIGAFEGSIERLVALAALMPIVASVGGNTGNQTVALVIRGLTLNQINRDNILRLLRKEALVGLMNGLIWGAVVGGFALLFYQRWSLGLLMVVAMLLNLLIASVAGVFIPLALHRLGRDPVMGSSVMLTAITDCMGFFLFLGLAALFLL